MNTYHQTEPTAAKPRYYRLRHLGMASLLSFSALLWGCDEENPASEESSAATAPAAHPHAAHTHAAAGETCFICDPSKREPGRLWCNEHGRYEDRCWECQPQLRDANRPYCEEHSLYEDECFLCDPSRARAAPRPGSHGATP